MPTLLTDIAVGFAPPWIAALVWLIIACAAAAVWRAIRRQEQRERHRRTRIIRDHERRLLRIECQLFGDTDTPPTH